MGRPASGVRQPSSRLKGGSMTRRETLQSATGYAAAVVLCLALLTWLLRLWEADFSVPFAYFGDSLTVLTCIKATVENGWFLHNDSLAAPAGFDFHDYPTADALHYLLMKLLALDRKS